MNLVQVPLPADVAAATPAEWEERIVRAKKALGRRLVVLGHHYQRDEVIRHADVTEPYVSPVWHQPWVFLLAILCLTAEWGLRRWKGLP